MAAPVLGTVTYVGEITTIPEASLTEGTPVYGRVGLNTDRDVAWIATLIDGGGFTVSGLSVYQWPSLTPIDTDVIPSPVTGDGSYFQNFTVFGDTCYAAIDTVSGSETIFSQNVWTVDESGNVVSLKFIKVNESVATFFTPNNGGFIESPDNLYFLYTPPPDDDVQLASAVDYTSSGPTGTDFPMVMTGVVWPDRYSSVAVNAWAGPGDVTCCIASTANSGIFRRCVNSVIVQEIDTGEPTQIAVSPSTDDHILYTATPGTSVNYAHITTGATAELLDSTTINNEIPGAPEDRALVSVLVSEINYSGDYVLSAWTRDTATGDHTHHVLIFTTDGGVVPVTCTPPRRLAIPHRAWAYGQRADWFADNWRAIERWARAVKPAELKCALHIPRKHDPTPEGARANYNALRRWVDSDCLCCAVARKHQLPVPGLHWSHQTYMLTVERWVDMVIATCAEAD